VLSRERAGWLVAREVATNWRWRTLTLFDLADQPVAEFVGSLAWVRVQHSGEPAATSVPKFVPVATLIGAWWPHPARRMTQVGTYHARARWRDPALADFPRHERRERIKWALLYGSVAAFFVAAALVGSSAAWVRLAFGAAGVGLLAWCARLLRWRPTYPDVA
jgi:hypothetical protein